MSTEHRRPAVAFAILAIVAAAVVGVQRAEAQGGRLLAAVVGAGVSVQGTLPRTEPVAAAVLDDTGLFPGGSLLILADAPAAKGQVVAAVEPTSEPAVAPAAATRGSVRTPSAVDRDRADPGRTTRAPNGGKRDAAVVVRRGGPEERRSPARTGPAAAVSASSSRASSVVSATYSPSPRAASSPRAVDPPRRPVLRKDSRPGRARSGHHGHAHRKVHRAAHHAAARKIGRR